MFKSVLMGLGAAGIAFSLVAAAQAQPARLAAFDMRSVQGWADRLALCDATAFLSSRPDLNSNTMWVRRDDGHRDLLLPPRFIGAGRWYKEGYERLSWRLIRQGRLDVRELRAAQERVSHDFVEAYRRGHVGQADMRFLWAQDRACRAMAREQGEIIS